MEKVNELLATVKNTQIIKDGENVVSSWKPVTIAFNDETEKPKIDEILEDVKQLRNGYDKIARAEKSMFSIVARMVGGSYHTYCKGFKSINDFIATVTDGKIKKSTITEYVKVAKRFYYASGKPKFDGVELMDTHALYLMSNLDDSQFTEFEDALLLFTKKEKGEKFTRQEMLTVFKAIQDKRQLTDNNNVEVENTSKKTNYKEKAEKLEEALETVKSEVTETTGNLNNAIDCLNAISDFIESNKSIKIKEFNDMLTRYKLNDLLLKSHEKLEQENPYN